MSRQIVRDRRGPAPKINMKELPPGHCLFKSFSKSQKGLCIVNGYPYDLAGNLLPLDVAELRSRGHMMNEDIIRQLALHAQKEEASRTKVCVACSADIPLKSKFCIDCGREQQIWVAGMEGGEDGDAISRLLDPEDPLGSLGVITTADENLPERESPDAIFARLSANEERDAKREMPKGALSALGSTGDVKASSTPIGSVSIPKEGRPGRKK